MGKASRNKRTGSARDRIAAQRAAEKRRAVRMRIAMVGSSVVVVLAIVAAFALYEANRSSNGGQPSSGTTLSAAVIHDVTAVPAATLNSVGAGTVDAKSIITLKNGTALTSAGKPEVLYIGAEYCPYCATERWAVAVALSRFGTFSGLHGIHSSSTDVYPSTPTLTFYKSTYTSTYLSFVPVETETVAKKTLQTPTKAQSALIAKYDAPPYVSADSEGSIPFIDFGNKYMISGASYNPQILQGKTWAQVAAALKDPSSTIAKGVDGTANLITATICKLTNNQPATACTSVVKSMEGQV